MSIELKESEAQAYYDAADELYDMYIEAADYVIENELFFDVGVPFNLIAMIKKSWENDVHWHIYGAFQFFGGYDGTPLKLIGFDADTPNALVQTSQEQLQDNQFNEIYEKVTQNLKRLITLEGDLASFDEKYDGWKILFSAPDDDEEKIQSSKFLQEMAEKAGFETSFSYLHEVVFSEEGISDADGQEYEYWFKNYSYADMASQEPELLTTLTSIINNQKAIILNPAYTMLFQAKGMIDILHKLYPDSPYLQKVDDALHNKNVANVFFAYEACGLSFTQEDLFVTHTFV